MASDVWEWLGGLVKRNRNLLADNAVMMVKHSNPAHTIPNSEPPNNPQVDLAAGDFVLHQVSNGYVIKRVVLHATQIPDTWVTEGGLNEVAKQLIAINATDEIKKTISPAGDPRFYAQTASVAGTGKFGVAVGPAEMTAIYSSLQRQNYP